MAASRSSTIPSFLPCNDFQDSLLPPLYDELCDDQPQTSDEIKIYIAVLKQKQQDLMQISANAFSYQKTFWGLIPSRSMIRIISEEKISATLKDIIKRVIAIANSVTFLGFSYSFRDSATVIHNFFHLSRA